MQAAMEYQTSADNYMIQTPPNLLGFTLLM